MAAAPAEAKVTVWPEETEPPISSFALLKISIDPVPVILPVTFTTALAATWMAPPSVTVPPVTVVPLSVSVLPASIVS